MKPLLITLAYLFASTAMATQKINFVSCWYEHYEDGWFYRSALFTENTFDLNKGQSRQLNEVWTSSKPKPPNYAVCNYMTGTDDDNTVVIKSFKYEATAFDVPTADLCEFTGQDIKLVSAEEVALSRGISYDELSTDWLALNPDRFIIRTYFPTVDEIDHIKDIVDKKCVELMPTTQSFSARDHH